MKYNICVSQSTTFLNKLLPK